MQWEVAGLAILVVSGLAFVIKRWVGIVEERAYYRADEANAQERIRFLQRLDHELKNPLTAMQIALANLDAIEDNDKKSEIRQGMRGQVERMSRLIADLRKLALLDKTLIEQVMVDPSDLLHEVAQIFQDNDEMQHRHFVQDFDTATLPSIIGDRDLLQMAIYNLLDNALKFTQQGATIWLRAYRENHLLYIEIEDTGPGIAREDVPHIWEDLYRSKSVQGIPGSGIGLAMVKGIIERHGGDVDVSSEVQAGTKFVVSLPSATVERA